MNFAASLCRRLTVSNLVTKIPVYSSARDVTGDGLSMIFRRWATKKTAGSTKTDATQNPRCLVSRSSVAREWYLVISL
ncbi:unnamed protein product [Lactuca virosa]|uniref:Uncharacterized protein n=1 Tax=Lactuca virosa TaxID=75947 RepID=A0AAU9MV25_9ASTR|nr:unnamed protein product [Lactuca virosa]